MKTNLDCIYCILNKADERYGKSVTDPSQKLLFMKQVFQLIGTSSEEASAPFLSKCVNDLLKQKFGSEDNYAEIKSRYNQLMLDMEGKLEQTITASSDPLRSALQFAMVGNFIDFAAMDTVSTKKLHELLQTFGNREVGQDEYNCFRQNLQASSRMAYLLDNAGEIVCDKLLIKTIRRLYPLLQVTAVVRGQPVFNDATMRDAEEVGLSEIVEVVDNGTDIPGTDLKQIGAAAGSVIESAEILLSKGQGNFETLYGCGKNIYYTFLCKCELFVKRFGVPEFTGLFVNERRLELN